MPTTKSKFMWLLFGIAVGAATLYAASVFQLVLTKSDMQIRHITSPWDNDD